MSATSRYPIIKSLLVGLVWQTHCFPTLPHGKIICVSDQLERMGTKVEDTFYLTTSQVKARVIKTYSELDLRRFLEEIPQFYKYKSTIFTDLDQRNSMKHDYILMKNQLQSIKDEFYSTSPESMNENDFNKVSKTIQILEAFQKLIQKGIQERIYKMKDHGSRIKEGEILGLGDNGSLKKTKKIASPSLETAFTRELGLDLVEQISNRVWDGQVDKLSGILHGISLPRDNDHKIIIKGNELLLQLQNLLFQQVGYMYKQELISREAFKKFCKSKITLEIAALSMIHTTECPGNVHFKYLSPLTLLNNWTSENYRNIYEVLDEKNKRYFAYILLKEFDYKFTSIGDFQLSSLFKDDKLFHTLENLVSPKSRNSYPRMTLQELSNQDINYAQIKQSVQELIFIFQLDNEDDPFKILMREWSFFFLDFIRTHYGLEIFELQKGQKFEENMNFISSGFEFLRELSNIYCYMEGGEIPGRKIPENEKNQNGEEILMIYKLSRSLISKHQSLFSYAEMSKYYMAFRLKTLKEIFDRCITKNIDQHKYYFQVENQSP